MSRSTTLCVLALLLLATLTHAARREPVISNKLQLPEIEATEILKKEDDACNGVGEEECLIRRTLLAHIDYIYTQKNKP